MSPAWVHQTDRRLPISSQRRQQPRNNNYVVLKIESAPLDYSAAPISFSVLDEHHTTDYVTGGIPVGPPETTKNFSLALRSAAKIWLALKQARDPVSPRIHSKPVLQPDQTAVMAGARSSRIVLDAVFENQDAVRSPGRSFPRVRCSVLVPHAARIVQALAINACSRS